jgi:hypothetical protein
VRASDTKSPGRYRSIAKGRLAVAVVDGLAEMDLTGDADAAADGAGADEPDGDAVADAEGAAGFGSSDAERDDDAAAAATAGAAAGVEGGEAIGPTEPHDQTTAARHSAASPLAECAAERSRAPIPA